MFSRDLRQPQKGPKSTAVLEASMRRPTLKERKLKGQVVEGGARALGCERGREVKEDGLPSGRSYGWRSHGRREAAIVDGKNILICTFPAFTARTSWRTSKGESLGLSSKSGRRVL